MFAKLFSPSGRCGMSEAVRRMSFPPVRRVMESQSNDVWVPSGCQHIKDYVLIFNLQPAVGAPSVWGRGNALWSSHVPIPLHTLLSLPLACQYSAIEKIFSVFNHDCYLWQRCDFYTDEKVSVQLRELSTRLSVLKIYQCLIFSLDKLYQKLNLGHK